MQRLLQIPGVDPTARNNLAIRFASMNGHFQIVQRLLMEHNVDPTADGNAAIQLASENDGKFDFAIPDSGGTFSNDNMIIPYTSNLQTETEKLINYYYDPAVAAEVAAYVTYVCPVVGAQAEMEKIDPALAKNELIFPTAKTQSRLQVFRPLTPAEETEFSTAFQKAVGN